MSHESADSTQRLLDYRLENAVWPDAFDLDSEPKEISFEHLGGRKIGNPIPSRESAKPIDFSHLGGICVRSASDASEENDQGNTD